MHKTKTFWAGVAGIVAGVGMIFQGESAAGVQLIGTSLIGIFLRHGIKKGN